MPEIPDQPDGIDPDAWPPQLPDVAAAAERVGAFIRSWGDGRIDTAEGYPLYARDLEALVQFASSHQREPGQLPVVVTVTDMAAMAVEMYGRERALEMRSKYHAVPLAHDYRFKIDFMDGGSMSLPAQANLTANEVADEVLSRRQAKGQAITNVELPEEIPS